MPMKIWELEQSRKYLQKELWNNQMNVRSWERYIVFQQISSWEDKFCFAKKIFNNTYANKYES